MVGHVVGLGDRHGENILVSPSCLRRPSWPAVELGSGVPQSTLACALQHANSAAHLPACILARAPSAVCTADLRTCPPACLTSRWRKF